MDNTHTETDHRILVRNATLEDLEEISTIIQNNFRISTTMQDERLASYLEANSLENLKKKQFDNPDVTVLAAETEGKIVGTYIFEDKGTYMKSKKAHILPEYQSRGIAYEFASILVKTARSKGRSMIQSKTTKEAVPVTIHVFSDKLGLSVTTLKHNCEPPLNYTLVEWSVD